MFNVAHHRRSKPVYRRGGEALGNALTLGGDGLHKPLTARCAAYTRAV